MQGDYFIHASNETTEATIHSVIVFKGPGTWKEKALWDEYVVTTKNNGLHPIEFAGAELIDIEGTPQYPGTDPWSLEKLSKENWKHYGEAGISLTMGSLGAGLTAGTAGLFYYLGGSAAAGAALAVVPVVVVADLVYVQVKNGQNRKLVDNEFERRRLDLPIIIGPNESIRGSLFFPQVPGPLTFSMIFNVEADSIELEFDLRESLIGNLHIE